MNIVLTGSVGHIGKPLAQILVKKGHSVTIISSSAERQNEIEALGAKAAIGLFEDAEFLAAAFTGADIVYLMKPPINFFDPNSDEEAYWVKIGKNYVQAVLKSGVTKIVELSSIGGHTATGVGMLGPHHLVEQILGELPGNVSIKTMRPVGFYYNMMAFMPAIKNAGAIFQNYGGDEPEPWVSPLDIAETIAEEMEAPFNGRCVRYIASEEVSPNEVAVVLGAAIGKSDLKWIAVTDEQFFENLMKVGFSEQAAKGLTEANASRVNGVLYEDYYKHPLTLGKVKLASFAKEFATIYNNKF
jgi:uncharacterized protein YbjT (DUF2867 family)